MFFTKPIEAKEITIQTMRVTDIAFSQAKVSATFTDGRTLASVTAALMSGEITVADIPIIRIVKYNRDYYTLDNRRLRVFKDAYVDEITVQLCDLKGPQIKREFSQKKSNKSAFGGGDVRQPQLAALVSHMRLGEQFDNGPYLFTKKVLGWSFEQLQATLLHANHDIASVSAFADSDSYYESFLPLILEETRAMILAGLQAAKTSPGAMLTMQLKIEKSKIANHADNPSTLDFLTLNGPQNTAKAGDVFLLQHSRIPELKFLAIANYVAPTELQPRLSFKLIIDLMSRISYGDEFGQGVLWQAMYLTSIITMTRMYDVCVSKPYVSFMDGLIEGQLRPKYHELFDPKNHPLPSHLNTSQQNAVLTFLSIRKGLQLVQGPPGTGKTTTIIYVLQQLLQQGLRVLVCAPSNKAIHVLAGRFCFTEYQTAVLLAGAEDKLPEDNTPLQEIFLHTWPERLAAKMAQLREKLWQIDKHAASITDGYFQGISEDFNRLLSWIGLYRLLDTDALEAIKQAFSEQMNTCKQYGASIKTPSLSEVQKEQQEKLLRLSLSGLCAVLRKLELQLQPIETQQGGIEKQLLDKAKLIFCTLSVAGRKTMQEMAPVDVLIVDEAGQAVEAEFLIGLFAQPKKCLVIGDPKQLPATVISKEAAKSGFERSLMTRLIEQCEQPFDLLDTQYRMHPEISRWPSSTYYDSQLKDAENVLTKPTWQSSNKQLGPYTFIHLESQEEFAGNSVRNPQEATLIIDLLVYLKRKGAITMNTSVAIITFYSAQAQCINYHLDRNRLKEFRAHTVDSFQGNEADIVIVSCVRANKKGSIGFLQDFRRLNVAITRAKDALMIIGDAMTLKRAEHSDIANLVNDADERKCRVSASELQNQWKKPTPTRRTVDHGYARDVCRYFRPENPKSCRYGDQCAFQHTKVETKVVNPRT